MKIARIIGWQLDSTLRPTMKRGFDIIPTCAGIDMIHDPAAPLNLVTQYNDRRQLKRE